ncbi:MAG: arsenate reductase ArsC [Pseudomonadota bacterium]
MARATVLVLCTGNSARSILGEALLDAAGFEAHSAGSRPRGDVHPMALRVLAEEGFATDRYRSKSWDEFSDDAEDAPTFDVVVTVCDSAAGETCPLWHGSPVRTHWGLPDPAAVDGSEASVHAAFKDTFRALKRRVDAFKTLDLDTMDARDLKAALDAIGAMDGAP